MYLFKFDEVHESFVGEGEVVLVVVGIVVDGDKDSPLVLVESVVRELALGS